MTRSILLFPSSNHGSAPLNTLLNTSGPSINNVEAGDILTYTVALTNGGNATAYEVNFNDTLAPGTAFGAIQTAARSTGPGFHWALLLQWLPVLFTFSDTAWDLDPGEILTLTYTVNVTSAALVDGTHTNTR